MPRISRFDGPEPSCLYPDEKEIGRVLMGPARGKGWPAIAQALERSGLPPIDPQFGGRYWPAVKAFLDRYNRIDGPAGQDVSNPPSKGRRKVDAVGPAERLRPEKRFSRLIDEASERRRKAKESLSTKGHE